MTRAIEIHNGKVVFGTSAKPHKMDAGERIFDFNAEPSVAAMGDFNMMRLRGNVPIDVTSGTFIMLDLNPRAVADIPYLVGLNITANAREDSDISGELKGIMSKVEVEADAGTIAKAIGLDINMALKKAATLSTCIGFQAMEAQSPDYLLDAGDTNYCTPKTSLARFKDDSATADADGSLGAAAGFLLITIDDTEYKLQTYAVS